MQQIFTLFFIFTSSFLIAQTSFSDFEDISIEDLYLNGSDGSGGFTSGDLFFPNTYNTQYFSWSGWAISKNNDVTTPGYENQFSAITGEDYDADGTNYAISGGVQNVIRFNQAHGVKGMYITNSTYAYLSMQNGDSFAKKFGGETGDDEDFFRLKIKAFNNGEIMQDSVEFYLADFRFSDNSEDYIVNEWTYVDLSTLGDADSLSFTLESSDVGQFGMNTPAYFCVDAIETNDFGVGTNNLADQLALNLYPNPTIDYLNVNWNGYQGLAQIISLDGKVINQRSLTTGVHKFDVSKLKAGSYLFQIKTEEGIGTKLFTIR